MRILQVIPSLALGFGGPTNAVLQLSFALAHKGQEVNIFTTDAGVNSRLNVPLETAVNIQNVRLFYFPVQYFRHYKFSFPLAKALKKNIPYFDVVHIHSLFQFSTLAASYYCRKFNKPYMIRPLGQLDPFLLQRHSFYKRINLMLFDRKNLEEAWAVHFTTGEEKYLADKLNLNIRSRIVSLGVNCNDFTNLPEYGIFRSKYPALKNKKVILFLSRINFKKGLDILIKAFARLKGERNDLCLVIAGPDNEGYGAKVKKWLNKEGVLNSTVFVGMLLGEDKLAAFRDSDIFVLPSYSENFGIAAVEAMACGVPTVISNKVGIYREVQENNAGVVVECNETSLYLGIRSVLDNDKLREELSLSGKKMAQEHYNIDKVADRMIEIYKEMIVRKK